MRIVTRIERYRGCSSRVQGWLTRGGGAGAGEVARDVYVHGVEDAV